MARAAGGGRAQHGAFTHSAGVGVSLRDAQRNHVGAYGDKRIGPRRRLVDIHIHALGGQGDGGELGALVVLHGGCSLGFLLGLYGGLSHAHDSLFFLVAGCGIDGEKQSHSRQNDWQYPCQAPGSLALIHGNKDSRSRVTAKDEENRAGCRRIASLTSGEYFRERSCGLGRRLA